MPQVGPHEVVVITTSSVEGVQGELEIVQRKVIVAGMLKPVTPVLYKVASAKVAEPPDTTVHKPVPGEGLFPANVAVVTPQAGFWSSPALAAGAAAVTVTEAVLAFTQPQVLHADKL